MSVIPLSAQAKTFSQRLFDQAFYLNKNSDVLTAVLAGLTTAFEHFSTFGHRENRLLLPFFDAQAYLIDNFDVAGAATQPGWVSAWNHFVLFGILEGRSPNGTAGFSGLFDDAKYLQQNDDVKDAVSNGAFRNGFEHYLLFGAKEGRAAFNKAGNAIDLQSSVTPGKTFTLTNDIDVFTGTGGNDVFSGALNENGQVTFQAFDKLNGGGGRDTLIAQGIGTISTNATTLQSIERIEVYDMLPSATLDLANTTGVEEILIANALGNATVSGINSGIKSLEVTGNPQTGAADTFTFTLSNTAVSGTADSVTLKLSGVGDGGKNDNVTVQPTSGSNGYETINIESVTNPNYVTLDDGSSTSLKTVTVKGGANLTLNLVPATVTEVDASAFTGQLKLTVAQGNAQNMKITGGSKNDVIDMNSSYNASDIIDGGDGIDRLVLTPAEAINATTVQSNVSNIEVIELAFGLVGTVTVSNFGATGLRFGGNMTGPGTVNYAAGTNSLDLQQHNSGGNALTVNVAGTATNDVLNVTLGADTVGNNFGPGNVTINGAETVNLLVQGGLGTFGGNFNIINSAATEALVITGSQSVTFTGVVRADIIDASGMTGAARLIMNDIATGGAGTAATVITGTANNDTLVGSTAADIINGGAGNDRIANRITGVGTATAGDVLTGGAGFDTFILRGAAASGTPLLTLYNDVPFITDFTVGSTASTTDILALSATLSNYSTSGGFFTGVAQAGAGATTVVDVPNVGTVNITGSTTDLIRLTTGVMTTGSTTAQAAFNAAIGSAQVTGLAMNTNIFVMFYDITNSRAVIGLVNTGTNTSVETGDTVTIIGSIAMSASDYAAFNQNNLEIVVA